MKTSRILSWICWAAIGFAASLCWENCVSRPVEDTAVVVAPVEVDAAAAALVP